MFPNIRMRENLSARKCIQICQFNALTFSEESSKIMNRFYSWKSRFRVYFCTKPNRLTHFFSQMQETKKKIMNQFWENDERTDAQANPNL